MKRFCRALWLLLITSVFYPLAAQTQESVLVDAVQLYSEGKVAAARDMLLKAVERFPEDDALWYYLSQSQSACGELDAALGSMEKAVAIDSSNYWYRRLQARLSLANGKADEGTALYEALLKDFPDKEDPVYELLDLYLNRKEFEKALSVLDNIEQLQGPSEAVARTRYDVLTTMGRQDEGAQLLEQFNQQYSLPSILSMLGDYYLSEFSDSLAQARYSEALELDSSYVPAILGMSEVHRHARRYDEYFRTLEGFFGSPDIPGATKSMYIGNMVRSLDPKMLQLHREGFDKMVNITTETHPSDTTVLSTAGTYFYSTGRQKEAGQWFKAASEAAPESIPLAATYVQYLSLQEDWTAMRDYALAYFQRSNEMGFLEYANMASYQLKDYDTILDNCQYILTNYPKDKDLCLSAYSMAGDVYHEKGNSKEAYKAYEKALKIDPGYAPVLNNYAYYLCLEGKKLKKAYQMSKKTVEAEPDNATYLDTFAWILHLMGKDLEAKPFFKHAMLYGGKESAVILRHYATVLEALGEADTAEVYRRQANRLEK